MRPTLVTSAVTALVLTVAGSRHVGADDPVSVAVRYNREIVRIFERKCVVCHAEGAPSMPLATYYDVRPWARGIREEILERRMPPWPAAPGVRPLANELALTTREITIITAWVDGGTPRGEPSDLPPPKPHRAWRQSEPAVKLTVPAQQVKSDGSVQVRRVRLAPPLSRDQWLRGFDVVPGARQALRSAFLYAKDAGGERWLGGWSPWYAMTDAPAHVGFKLAKGTSLEIELHYSAWDEPAALLTDASLVGLYVHGERPAIVGEAMTVSATPVGQHEARGETVAANDTVVWAVRPQMMRDGSAQPGSLELRAILTDGRTEPIVWIKDNRADWQLPYVLREPLRLPRGARIVLSAHGEGVAAASVTASLLTYRAAAPAPTSEPAKATMAGRPGR